MAECDLSLKNKNKKKRFGFKIHFVCLPCLIIFIFSSFFSPVSFLSDVNPFVEQINVFWVHCVYLFKTKKISKFTPGFYVKYVFIDSLRKPVSTKNTHPFGYFEWCRFVL